MVVTSGKEWTTSEPRTEIEADGKPKNNYPPEKMVCPLWPRKNGVSPVALVCLRTAEAVVA